MTRKVYTVTDLGPGDGGKGGVVHKITTMTRAKRVVKVGGAQGSHGVATSSGERFAFSQWGCGTFEGVKTHLSSRMVIAPEGLLNEAEALRYRHGIYDPFDLLTIDETALCSTPFHGIASRLKELARGGNPRGTIGTGVGEAYRFMKTHPELAIFAGDLRRTDLKDRLAATRDHVRTIAAPLVERGTFSAEDRAAVAHEMDRLYDDGFLDYVVRRFHEVVKLGAIVDGGFLEREILSEDDVVVVESSHGVLTDCYMGFHPHTSALRTLPRFTRAMFKEAGYDGEFVSIGVTRAYAVRHGAGPMPTADPAMAEHLLPGSSKEENRYQGKVRVGPLDIVLLRYAIAACGGPDAFQGLAVTWFDQIKANGAWQIADRYRESLDARWFSRQGNLIACDADDDLQLKRQENLGAYLSECTPDVTAIDVAPIMEREALFDFCAGILNDKLNVPVRMVSLGPTEVDKLCK
jgi:adenylosuccinate synthase